MKTIFSQNLAAFRRDAGISQREASAALGVSQALLSHYETGTREPGLDFVVRAADYYHVSTDLLLHRPDAGKRSMLYIRHFLPLPKEISEHGMTREHMTEELLAFLMDQLNVLGDEEITLSALNYVEDAMYELLRHLARIYEGYDPETLSKLDPGMESRVMSDMNVLRVRYVSACMAYHNSGITGGNTGSVPMEQVLTDRYGTFSEIINTLIKCIHERISDGTPKSCPDIMYLTEPTEGDTDL